MLRTTKGVSTKGFNKKETRIGMTGSRFFGLHVDYFESLKERKRFRVLRTTKGVSTKGLTINALLLLLCLNAAPDGDRSGYLDRFV